MRTPAYFLALSILCRVSSYSATCQTATWLMQGDALTDEEAASRLVRLDTHKTYLPVSSQAEVFYKARHGKLIGCVIAAAVNQHGHVRVVEGGYGRRKVRIRYTTADGRPDVLFVLVQAVEREPAAAVSVEENVARSARLDIVDDSMRNWTMEEVQQTLRNVSSSLFPS